MRGAQKRQLKNNKNNQIHNLQNQNANLKKQLNQRKAPQPPPLVRLTRPGGGRPQGQGPMSITSKYGYYCAFDNTPHSAVTPMAIGHATAATEDGMYTLQGPPRYDNDEEARNCKLLFLYPFAGEVMGYVYEVLGDAKVNGSPGAEPLAKHTMTKEQWRDAMAGSTPTNKVRWQMKKADDSYFSPPKYYWDEPPACTEIRALTWGRDRPEEVLPTRMSVRILNEGADYQKGGKVRFLRATTGYAPPTTNAELLNIIGKVRANHRKKNFEGHQLGSTKQFNCIVADAFKAGQFKEYQPSNATEANAYTDSVLPAAAQGEDLKFPAMTPIIILFEPYGVDTGGQSNAAIIPNTYELTLAAHYFCHDVAGTRLNNQAILPNSSLAKIDAHTRKEGAENMLKDVVDAGKNFVGNMVHEGAQFLGNQMQQRAASRIQQFFRGRRTRRVIGRAGRFRRPMIMA